MAYGDETGREQCPAVCSEGCRMDSSRCAARRRCSLQGTGLGRKHEMRSAYLDHRRTVLQSVSEGNDFCVTVAASDRFGGSKDPTTVACVPTPGAAPGAGPSWMVVAEGHALVDGPHCITIPSLKARLDGPAVSAGARTRAARAAKKRKK